MLKLNHIRKSYDGVPVLQDIDLEIDTGEIVSILGSSGSGKTTLLNVILGITGCRRRPGSCSTGGISPGCRWRSGGSTSSFRTMRCSPT